MTRARFQSELKHVDDTIGGKIEDSSDFAARQSSTEGPDPSVEDVTVDDRRSRQSIREPETATRHAAFARLSRQNHSPQSQPIDNSPSSIPSTPSSFASRHIQTRPRRCCLSPRRAQSSASICCLSQRPRQRKHSSQPRHAASPLPATTTQPPAPQQKRRTREVSPKSPHQISCEYFTINPRRPRIPRRPEGGAAKRALCGVQIRRRKLPPVLYKCGGN